MGRFVLMDYSNIGNFCIDHKKLCTYFTTVYRQTVLVIRSNFLFRVDCFLHTVTKYILLCFLYYASVHISGGFITLLITQDYSLTFRKTRKGKMFCIQSRNVQVYIVYSILRCTFVTLQTQNAIHKVTRQNAKFDFGACCKQP